MKFRGSWKLLPVVVAALSLFSACGKTNYNKQSHSATAVAGAYVTTKPKIDIVVFQDNSDSVMLSGVITQLNSQMQGFVNGLSDNWDFHFVVLPLLSTKSLSSKYVIAQDCNTITGVNKCLTPSQVAQFNTSGDYGWIRTVNSSVGSNDKGFQNIYSNLVQPTMTSTGFLRADAALAIIVLSNGEDTTDVGYSQRPDGFWYLDYNHQDTIDSYEAYRSAFANFKGNMVLSRFYSVVSPGGPCLGASSFNGKRYQDMADDLGSRYYNICNNELNSALSNISGQLQTVVESVVFNYAVISPDKAPDPSSLVVRKNGAVLPQSNVNGWSYVGFKTNQNTAFFPTAGHPKTGYMIKLNGTATFSGSETIDIEFDPL